MRCHQDGPAGCLIYTAGFHSYYTVFYNVNDADSVFPAQFVQFHDDLRNFHGLSVECFRDSGFKCHSYIFRFIRRFLRGYA